MRWRIVYDGFDRILCKGIFKICDLFICCVSLMSSHLFRVPDCLKVAPVSFRVYCTCTKLDLSGSHNLDLPPDLHGAFKSVCPFSLRLSYCKGNYVYGQQFISVTGSLLTYLDLITTRIDHWQT